MLRRFTLLFAFLSLLFTEAATAQILTPSLSLFYFQTKSKTQIPQTADEHDSAKSTDTYTFLNLGVCYNMSGLCLGLKYLQGELETKASGPGYSGNSTAVFHGPGVTVGYSGAEGAVAHATLLLGAKKDIASSSTTYFAKSAYMIELGYGFKVSSVRVGPLLALYEFEYNKVEVKGQRSTLRPNENDHFIMPQVALWVDL